MTAKTPKSQKTVRKDRQGVSSRFIEKAVSELKTVRNGNSASA